MEKMELRLMGEASWDDDGELINKDGDRIPASTFFDYTTHPDMVAVCLNDLLAEHGLEIVQYDPDGDDYVFALIKKD